MPIYINEVLRYQFVHRKISTLAFETDHVCAYADINLALELRHPQSLYPVSQAIKKAPRFQYIDLREDKKLY